MDKIDVLIPLKDDSKINYLDLIYTLRSIEKHLKNYGTIYIVGKVPKSIKNVVEIPFKELRNEDYRQSNIVNKTIFCLEQIKENNILFFNDEHFLLTDFNALTFPNYQDGEIEPVHGNDYRYTQQKTLMYLKEHNLPTVNFDVHTPIIYNKEKFLSIFKDLKFDRFGYCIKSIYGNSLGLKGTYMDDCKIRHKVTYEHAKEICRDKKIVSCNDSALKTGLGEYLSELFPIKSIYEN